MLASSLFAILAGAALALVFAWSLGRVLLAALSIRLSRVETELFAFMGGSACLSTLVFLLCTAGIAQKDLFIILCAAATAGAVRIVLRQPAQDKASLSGRQLLLLLVPTVPYVVLYFVNALTPETSPDGVTYHLGSVARWWTDHGFARRTDNVYANLPQGLEMMFLVAFSVGRHSAAKLVHFAFLLVLPCMIVAYGLRVRNVRPFILAAVVMFVSPVVGMSGTTAYVDVAFACAAFALYYALDIWADAEQQGLLMLAGLLAGFSYAIKYTGVAAVLYALCVIPWRLRRERAWALRSIAVFLLFAAIPSLPWMIKNLVWVGNPFSPFFNAWFPNPHIHISFERSYRAAMTLYPELKTGWQLPRLWSIGGEHIGGLFGPWLLLTPLALLSLRSALGRKLLVAAFLFGLPALTNNATRFLFPFAIFAAAALGIALESLSPKLTTAVIAISALVSWPDMVAVYADPDAWRLTGMPVAEALRIVPEEKHLRHWVEGYDMAGVLERVTPRNARILRLAGVPQAYTTRLLWDHFESANADLAFYSLYAGFEPGLQPYRRRSFRFAETLLRAIRIVEHGSGKDVWTVFEMRMYRQGSEVARQPDWRFTAWPNRWDAGRAFDGSEATFWSTWQPLAPHMRLQADFRQAIPIDQAAIECADFCGGALAAEGLGADGRWRTLSDKSEMEERHPAPEIRRAAAAAVKSYGFDYIVANVDEVPGKDLAAHTAEWGIEPVWKIGSSQLYRVPR